MKNLFSALANRRIRYITKGILVGIFAGIVVSLFRLGVEIILEHILDLYQFFHDKPLWLLPWALISILAANYYWFICQKRISH